VDNVKLDLGEIGGGGVALDWSDSKQGQIESSCECDNEPSGSIQCWGFRTGGLYSSAQLDRISLVSKGRVNIAEQNIIAMFLYCIMLLNCCGTSSIPYVYKAEVSPIQPLALKQCLISLFKINSRMVACPQKGTYLDTSLARLQFCFTVML
jgi:hypothetical protein